MKPVTDLKAVYILNTKALLAGASTAVDELITEHELNQGCELFVWPGGFIHAPATIATSSTQGESTLTIDGRSTVAYTSRSEAERIGEILLAIAFGQHHLNKLEATL